MNQLLKYSFVVFSFFMLMNSFYAQKMEETTHREVNIHFADSSIKSYFLLGQEKIRLKSDVYYFWYENNSIKINQGDYKGRLLDGKYEIVNRDGNLITKGEIRKGLKVNEWKDWHSNGDLLSVYNWTKGYKTGNFKKYKTGSLIEEGFYLRNHKNGPYKKFENDTLIEKGIYKNGFLDGKIIRYANDTILSVTKYKKGKEAVGKEKKDKRDKIQDKKRKQKEEREKKDKPLKSTEKGKENKKEKHKDVKSKKEKKEAQKKTKEPKDKTKKQRNEKHD